MKSKISLLLFISVLFMSCGDNDDDGNDSNAMIAGTYQLVSMTSSGFALIDFNGDGSTSENLVEELPCYEDTQLVLKNDLTFEFTVSDIESFLNNGDFTCFINSASGSYSLDGDRLTITDGDEEEGVLTFEFREGVLTQTLTDSDIYLDLDSDEDILLRYELQ
ncbi:lipocalin family protein [Aquimarina sp. ERC-38]|uniref:lipocalin family protein n=1 Tax=Aquimarina sp. ERC-38 TaxID=2949996 RepID=UPI0022457EE0|nr:lipocalin family protein [Aquimarina sp. ERC-38]UZO82007.1 lipocalin family protein [Aquimarina sp. ERC-38]